MMANVNEGHRNRLRERMINEGLQNFQDHEVLEMLLFQYLPRRDTNKLAHDLINKFGGLANVLNASPEQLMTVNGISKVTACNLAVLKEVWRRCRTSNAEKISLNKLSSIVLYSQKIMRESYVEKMVVVYVDHSTNFLLSEEFTSDNIDSLHVDLKRIVSTAVRANAAGVILFHCHVRGVCEPSEADLAYTEKLFVTLANLNLVLLEHIIFNDKDDYFSFFGQNLISELAEKYGKKDRIES